MTQAELQFRAGAGGQTQNQKLRAIFEREPNVWHAMPALASAIGAYAVHSRVADLRRLGMHIEQKSTHDGRRNLSSYRYLPATPPDAADQPQTR